QHLDQLALEIARPPEEIECLVEQRLVLVSLDEVAEQGGVEFLARADADRVHRFDRVPDRARSQLQAGAAQDPAEMDDIIREPSFAGGRRGYQPTALSSALTASSACRPSEPCIRAISSWYLSSAPTVSEMV